METIKYYLRVAWTWLKSRQMTTLAAGAAIGALADDPIIWFLRTLF